MISMRVTQNQMTRTFLRHMNTNLERLSKSQDRMTGQKYKKSAENISDTARAYRIRQELYDNELYTTNIRDIDAKLSSAESDLNSINSIMVTAREQIVLRGMNDTNKMQRVNLAQELEGNLNEIIQFANSQFSGRYLFDGSENGEPPFSVENGRLAYHHIPVDNIYKNSSGQLCYRYQEVPDPDNPGQTKKEFVEPDSYTNPTPPTAPVVEMVIPEDVDQFVDIGAGITMSGNRVEERSAFNLTFSGLEILGYGKTEDGIPKNVYSQLQDAIAELQKENGDFDRSHMEDISNTMKDSTEDLRLTVIDIGTKTQFLEKTLEGLENDNENLTKLQQKLEVADTAEESIAWKNYHALMMATYQFGSKVVPTSLMDFLQ
jgi:flagellin-like hook-associated protein FlgL